MEEENKGSDHTISQHMQKVELAEGPPENQLNLKNKKLKEKQKDEIVIMVVYQKSETGFGHSLKLFIEPGYAVGLLRRFSYTGTKVIGLEEYRIVNIERQKRTFPNDYPLSNAYRILIEKQAKDNLLKYCKKPPSKRLNFSKINSPYPFKSNWRNLSQPFITVFISMSQNTPEELFYICQPNSEDINLDSLEEITNLKTFKSLKLSVKDFNNDYERIYNSKVY